jgi:hypothetical protein
MRNFFVYVRFPELPASHAEQTATVQAGNWRWLRSALWKISVAGNM